MTKEIEDKYKRLDGKTLSKKQKEKLMQQRLAEEKRLMRISILASIDCPMDL